MTARVLMLVVVPGHLIFVYTIRYFKEGDASPTKIFIFFYLTAALVQVRKVLSSKQIHYIPDGSDCYYIEC
jgi:solute carrier family 41